MQIRKPKISKSSIFKSFILICFILNLIMLLAHYDIFRIKFSDEKRYIRKSQISILNLYKLITQNEILMEIDRDIELLLTTYSFERDRGTLNFDRYIENYLSTSQKYIGLEILIGSKKEISKLPQIDDEKIVKLLKSFYNFKGEPISLIVYYDLHEIIQMFNEYEKLTSDTLYFLKSSGKDLNQKRNHPAFKEKYVNEWKLIESELTGSFENENGIFTFITFPTIKSVNFQEKDMGNWILVIRYSDSKLRDLINKLLLERLVAVKYAEIPIILISLIIAYLMARRKSLYIQLQNNAIYDSITKVYNRNGGLNLLEKTRRLLKRSKEPISLCLVNVNGLKSINTRYGHEEGDKLLIKAADILSELIRESDAVIRLGGDEFLIMFPRCKDSEQSIIEERLIKKVKNYNEVSGKSYQLSLRYGFTELSPYSMEEIEKILKTCEKHMIENVS